MEVIKEILQNLERGPLPQGARVPAFFTPTYMARKMGVGLEEAQRRAEDFVSMKIEAVIHNKRVVIPADVAARFKNDIRYFEKDGHEYLVLSRRFAEEMLQIREFKEAGATANTRENLKKKMPTSSRLAEAAGKTAIIRREEAGEHDISRKDLAKDRGISWVESNALGHIMAGVLGKPLSESFVYQTPQGMHFTNAGERLVSAVKKIIAKPSAGNIKDDLLYVNPELRPYLDDIIIAARVKLKQIQTEAAFKA